MCILLACLAANLSVFFLTKYTTLRPIRQGLANSGGYGILKLSELALCRVLIEILTGQYVQGDY